VLYFVSLRDGRDVYSGLSVDVGGLDLESLLVMTESFVALLAENAPPRAAGSPRIHACADYFFSK
jgi:hypothetical protein